MGDRALARDAQDLTRLLPRVFRQVFTHDPGDPAFELPGAQLRVCAILGDGPLSITALARELGTSVSAATQLADRLETAGLVTRVAEAEDRRVKHLTLTPQGSEMARRRQARRLRRAVALLSRLSPEQRRAALDALHVLAEAALEAAEAREAEALL